MIRYSVSEKELRDLIEKEKRGWLIRAEEKTIEVIAAAKVGEKDGIWSEIKDVYIGLQGYKCIYCEKPMPRPATPNSSGVSGTAYGRVEYDVEHFRPKNRVQPWPSAEKKKARRIDYEAKLRVGLKEGYTFLAFDPLNYSVSCKTCNSELKGDRFPIFGEARSSAASIVALNKQEKPCLLLPIGALDIDPEYLFEWLGPFVRPLETLPPDKKLRARVIIDFFELDTRSDLLLSRCQVVSLLWYKLEELRADPTNCDTSKFIKAMCEPSSVFAACARAFVQLHKTDRQQANDWRAKAEQYVVSTSNNH